MDEVIDIQENHDVFNELCRIPIARRDRLTDWMWSQAPSHRAWGLALLHRALAHVGG